jgi:quercetin dioxygenase-like cupin family protein
LGLVLLVKDIRMRPIAAPVATPVATPVVHIDDDRFKVTEWRFAPGAETGWHRHGHDYVIVPLTDGRLILDLPGDQQAEAHLHQGVPYSRREGGEHNVINGSDSKALDFQSGSGLQENFAHWNSNTLCSNSNALKT